MRMSGEGRGAERRKGDRKDRSCRSNGNEGMGSYVEGIKSK